MAEEHVICRKLDEQKLSFFRSSFQQTETTYYLYKNQQTQLCISSEIHSAFFGDPSVRYSLWPVSQNLLYTFQRPHINITLFISWSFLWLVIHRAFALSLHNLIQFGPNIALYRWKWSSTFWKAEDWKSHQICKMQNTSNVSRCYLQFWFLARDVTSNLWRCLHHRRGKGDWGSSSMLTCSFAPSFLLGSSRQFSSRKSTEKPFFQLTLLKGRMDEKASCCNFSVIPQVGWLLHVPSSPPHLPATP